MKKSIFLIVLFIFALTIVSFKTTFALFSDEATSANNTFSTAAVFTSPSPSISPSISPEPSEVPISVTPTPIACTPGAAFASAHSNITQGLRKDDSPITDPNRTDPDKMLGAPDWVNGSGTNFFAMGKVGTVTLSFANPISSSGTEDLKIYEATNGRTSYPLEKAKVEVSLDGITYTEIGEATSEPSGDGISIFNLTSDIKFVRLTETTDLTPHDSTWDGVDIDALEGNVVCQS